MIPNCKGCQEELNFAFECQEAGINIALEGMGERKHCLLYFIEDENEKKEKDRPKNRSYKSTKRTRKERISNG